MQECSCWYWQEGYGYEKENKEDEDRSKMKRKEEDDEKRKEKYEMENRCCISSNDLCFCFDMAPLMPNASFNINFQIPFLQIEEKHRAVFMDSQSQIKVFPIDRRIQFANKQSLSD